MILVLTLFIRGESNVLVRRVKIHNDANIDISQDGRLICVFTIPARNFGGDIVLSVVSLRSDNFGECLFSKNFGKFETFEWLTEKTMDRFAVMSKYLKASSRPRVFD